MERIVTKTYLLPENNRTLKMLAAMRGVSLSTLLAQLAQREITESGLPWQPQIETRGGDMRKQVEED